MNTIKQTITAVTTAGPATITTETQAVAQATDAVIDYMTSHDIDTDLIGQCGHHTVEDYATTIIENIVTDFDSEGRFVGIPTEDAYDWRWATADITARAGTVLARLQDHRMDAFEIIDCEHCADA